MNFEGKTVLITGGASGIGAAMVSAFVHHGANVAFTYWTSATEAGALVNALGSKALAL